MIRELAWVCLAVCLVTGPALGGPVGATLEERTGDSELANLGDRAWDTLAALKQRTPTQIRERSTGARGPSGPLSDLITQADVVICGAWLIQFNLAIREQSLELSRMSSSDPDYAATAEAVRALSAFQARLEYHCDLSETREALEDQAEEAGADEGGGAALVSPPEDAEEPDALSEREARCSRECGPYLRVLRHAIAEERRHHQGLMVIRRERAEAWETLEEHRPAIARDEAELEDERERLARIEETLRRLEAAGAGAADFEDRRRATRWSLDQLEERLHRGRVQARSARETLDRTTRQLRKAAGETARFEEVRARARDALRDCVLRCEREAAEAEDPVEEFSEWIRSQAPTTMHFGRPRDTFTQGPAGWTVVGDAQGGAGVPALRQEGERSFLEATDDGGGEVWYWNAPRRYTGDQSDAVRGRLSFTLRQSATDRGFDADDVIYEGAAGRLVYTLPRPPGEEWTSYEVPLEPAPGWGEGASEVDFLDVFADVSHLRIRGEFRDGADTGGLASVEVQLPPPLRRRSPRGGVPFPSGGRFFAAHAIGEAEPEPVDFEESDRLRNGDFLVVGTPGSYASNCTVGEGVNERTRWTLRFPGVTLPLVQDDPKRLTGARLTLDLTVAEQDARVSTNAVFVHQDPDVLPDHEFRVSNAAIRQTPPGETTTVEVDLLAHLSPAYLTRALEASPPDALTLTFADDAVVSRALLELLVE